MTISEEYIKSIKTLLNIISNDNFDNISTKISQQLGSIEEKHNEYYNTFIDIFFKKV